MANGPMAGLPARTGSLLPATSRGAVFAMNNSGQLEPVFKTSTVGPMGGLATVWVFQDGSVAPRNANTNKTELFVPTANSQGGVKFVRRRGRKKINACNPKAFERSVKRIKAAEKICKQMFKFGSTTKAKKKANKRR